MAEYDDIELTDEDLRHVDPEDLPAIKNALRIYQVLAWVVGILLVLLTLVAMPIKYLAHDGRMVQYVGVTHGWLYAILLISVVNLTMKIKWSWKWLLGIALAGTVPFLSFFAERKATKYVQQRIDEIEAEPTN
ncbi:MAG: DUF3817 domain-containing protein [Propionibacteriaceae bacterium]|nr:DUF3817 domain-containing protein [Propionibacteriaceae bacterium]